MPDPARPVTVLHAFSRHNAGDGLLVDLTYEVLADAGVDRSQIAMLALDAASFPEFAAVIEAPGEPTASISGRLVEAAMQWAASAAGLDRVRRQLAGSRALVAVGGGYLVADSPKRQAGLLLNHLAQLRAAAAHSGPTIYLPQSIGPLAGLARRPTRAALARIDRVWVRDDVTLAELGLPNVRRCADLAVLKLAQDFAPPRRALDAGPPVIVARDLPDCGDYHARLSALRAALPEAQWAVQADIPGPRSDRAFYQRRGWSDHGTLAAVLETQTGPVVSVRLHGALSALLAGRPAIHLSYERKGWGAYEDLGLGEWVHDARSFDPAIVARQVDELARDANRFWDCVARAKAEIIAMRAELVADLSRRIGPAIGI